MTTHTDGAAPSVAPGPEGGRGNRAASAAEGEDEEGAVGDPDSGPLWLRDEIRRRVAANRAMPRGRHARRDGGERDVAAGYVPRHSESTPGPGAPPPRPAPRPAPPPAAWSAPPPRGPVAPPREPAGYRPAPQWSVAGPPTAPVFDVPGGAPEIAVPEPRTPGADASDPTGRRVRVVFSERRNPARPVGTMKEVQEGTAIGALLRTELIGSQLAVALRFAAVAGLSIGLLPLLFVVFPALGEAEVLGLRLPWLLLGVLVYPFLLGLGWWHTRAAERVEQNFAEHVQD